MIKIRENEPVWYERYQPQTVSDVILPEDIKKELLDDVENDTIPHLGLWSNTPGTGKSSTAVAILQDLQCEAMFINASLETGIDTIRNKISDFVSQQSFDGKRKAVVMDEFDNFSQQGQAAFRAFMGEYSNNVVFIFTGNYKNKIIEPLIQRLRNYEFDDFSKQDLAKGVFQRLEFILEDNKIEYDKKELVPIINTFYPSIREMVTFLQRFSRDGKLVVQDGELNNANSYLTLLECVDEMRFGDMIKEVNKMGAPENFFAFAYKHMDKIEPQSRPKYLSTIAKYNHMSSTVRDKDLNLSACLNELILGKVKLLKK